MFTQEVAYSTAYLAGIASFFSPCIFPIIPVYISILSNGEKKSVSKTLAFVLGLSVTYIVLGFGAGFIGELFLNSKVRVIGGILVVILGLFQMNKSFYLFLFLSIYRMEIYKLINLLSVLSKMMI